MYLLILLNNKTLKEETALLNSREYVYWKASNELDKKYTLLKIIKRH